MSRAAGARPLASFRGRGVHAVAGIGNPARFFAQLRALGLNVIEHPFPDHHPFNAAELDFADELPVLMTEKDAVKCARVRRGAHVVRAGGRTASATRMPRELLTRVLREDAAHARGPRE